LYRRYRTLAEATPNVHFVGRLGTYKYYNMDQVTGQALTLYSKLAAARQNGKPIAAVPAAAAVARVAPVAERQE
jgi:UDP-galactopyranose mutase